jgi:uncharacterized lipoprotein YddW (UPF0748 family)
LRCRGLVSFVFASFLIAPLPTGGAFAFQSTQLSTQRYLQQLRTTTTVQPANEIRALWVVRDALRSVETIDRMVDFAIQARFHLLFVQVRGRGDAYYRSTVEPAARDLELPIDDFDPLEYLLIRCRRAGISVHAWVNVFYVWSDPDTAPPGSHVVVQHPDWLLSSASGVRQDQRSVEWWQQDGIEGYYLSPAKAEVRAYTADVVRDLVSRYPLDGIHLDYVRYPGRGFTFGEEVRTRFALEWGIDPINIGSSREEMALVLGHDAVAVLDSIYAEWRVEHVDSAVSAIRSVTGDLPLSAAVVADDVVGRLEKGQDWVRWLRSDLVDFVVPMAYADTPLEIESRLRYFHNMVGRDRLLIGLALYDGRDRYLGETIPLIRSEGATGFSLFSYNVLADNPFAAAFIEESVFSTLPSEEEGTTGSDEESFDDADPGENGGLRP